MRTGFLILFLLLACLYFTGCATKRVMQDCEQINGGSYFICKEQWKIFR